MPGGSGARASSASPSAACAQAAVGRITRGGLVTLSPTLVFSSSAATGAVSRQLPQGWWLQPFQPALPADNRG